MRVCAKNANNAAGLKDSFHAIFALEMMQATSVMKSRSKSIFRLLGSVSALICLLTVGYQIYRQHSELIPIALSAQQYISLGVLTGISAASGILLGLAWRYILLHLGAQTSPSTALHIYGLSQIAKYLPGNVFHFAGRHGLAMAAGMPSWPLIKSTPWELGSLTIAALPFSIWATPLLTIETPFSSNFQIAIAFVFALLMLAYFFHHWFGQSIVRSFLLHISYLLISGLGFACVVATLSTSWPNEFWLISTCFVIAWLLGLVVPGAPAGIGIREAALLGLLSYTIDADTALIAVALSRIITAGGDTLFWLAAFSIGQNKQKHHPIKAD